MFPWDEGQNRRNLEKHGIAFEDVLSVARTETRSRSKTSAETRALRDIIGLYVDPPAHSLVLSVDEKSQFQALDRTQPGLPMKKGKAGTMTFDYKRSGTTTLFAAMRKLVVTLNALVRDGQPWRAPQSA